MDRCGSGHRGGIRSRPHARGDGPSMPNTRVSVHRQAPRTWGWTGQGPFAPEPRPAGPTHVGMDHKQTGPEHDAPGRPHARGDGPARLLPGPRPKTQAPRTWGWTVDDGTISGYRLAGPTHVGMDRQRG